MALIGPRRRRCQLGLHRQPRLTVARAHKIIWQGDRCPLPGRNSGDLQRCLRRRIAVHLLDRDKTKMLGAEGVVAVADREGTVIKIRDTGWFTR